MTLGEGALADESCAPGLPERRRDLVMWARTRRHLPGAATGSGLVSAAGSVPDDAAHRAAPAPEGLVTWDDVELVAAPVPVPGPGRRSCATRSLAIDAPGALLG